MTCVINFNIVWFHRKIIICTSFPGTCNLQYLHISTANINFNGAIFLLVVFNKYVIKSMLSVKTKQPTGSYILIRKISRWMKKVRF